jgi:hypothetical protein
MMEQVPLPEITPRGTALQKALAGQNLDLALVHQAADLFYYTGTLVDGFLAVAPQGSPLLLVRRPQHRIATAPPSGYLAKNWSYQRRGRNCMYGLDMGTLLIGDK